MVDYHTDILIIGGGPIGMSLMRALAPSGLGTLLVDKGALSDPSLPEIEGRSLALSAASVRIFKMLDLWPLLLAKTTAIHRIHVSEQGRFGSAYLQSDNHNPLAYVVSAHSLNRILRQAQDPANIFAASELIACDPRERLATIRQEGKDLTIQARLIVAADGADSVMRSLCQLPFSHKNYDQHAILATVGLTRSHHHIAYERFTPAGPLALLPISADRMALVWCLSPAEAERFMQKDDAAFLHALSQAFGYRLGRLVDVGRRVVYPLRQIIMTEQVKEGVLFIGNAAHTLHPVAGQGLNLGLRDVAMLAQQIMRYGLDDPALLAHYCQTRRQDHSLTKGGTDFLLNLYARAHPGMVLARSLGVLALDNSFSFKRLVTRYASGLAGIVPDLVCGISLQEDRCLMS